MLRGVPLTPNRLILYPTDHRFAPENLESFIVRLQSANYIGSQWHGERFLVGEEFLSVISFLGCSPSLQMEPLQDSSDLRFCHFHIAPPLEQPKLTTSSTIKPPLCRHCRTALPTWYSQSEKSHFLKCTDCDKVSPCEDWIWRKKAMCFVRFQIDICNIFESEAVPSASLLQLLKDLSSTSWDYCYITP